MVRRSSVRSLGWMTIGIVACVAACDRAPISPVVPPDTEITARIDQQGSGIAKGISVQLTVTVTATGGRVVLPDSIHWTGGDASTAPLTCGGLITALKATPSVSVQAVVFRGTRSATATASFSILEFIEGDAQSSSR